MTSPPRACSSRFTFTDWLNREGAVYVFAGEHHGEGIIGGPLVVPARVLETLTWTELVERAKESV